jgi:FAD/FMN-containing dehydrogenase
VLRFYDQFARACPDGLSVNVRFGLAADGVPVVGIGVAWIGPLDEGERQLKPLRSFGTPLADLVQPTSYVDKQRAGDSIYPPGRRHYWKAGFIRRLGPDAIDVLIDFFARRPSPYAIIALQQMHGAAARVSPAATAFAHRHDQWECMMLGQWERPEDDEGCIAWTRELYARMEPYLERAVYVNSLDHDEPERVPIAYGSNYDRLAAIKARYDPGNFFRANQNVVEGA